MPTRIVASTYRYKRPPRKKPQAITGPAVVSPRSTVASAIVQRGVKPGINGPRKVARATKPKDRQGRLG